MKIVSRRQQRVADLLKKEISAAVQNNIRDPRIGFITVTSVDISPDLHNARVYVQVMGDEKARKSTMIGLGRAASSIRSMIAPKIHLRYLPNLDFRYDDSLDAYEHIDEILKEAEHGTE